MFREAISKVDSLNEQNKIVSNDLQKMKEELVKHKISENYFSNILSSQTTLFSLIITGLLALASTFTIFQFNHSIKKTEEKFNNNMKNLEAKWQKHDDLIKEALWRSDKKDPFCSDKFPLFIPSFFKIIKS